jgi:threonyl-tRNA synthetase
MYKTFGLEFHLELSTRPEKAIGTLEQWEQSTDILKLALQDAGHDFIINEGDGAFYGPKIDIHIKDAIGRTWQCGTIQLDMMLPERFDLSYIGQDGNKQRPIMIHRVIYGSIERFLGILVEHFAGKFPLWMAPQQVRILPITDIHHQYARQVKQQFDQAGLRVAVDDSTESISKKVRLAQLDQVNYILVVGDREIAENSVTVRADNKVKGASPVTEVISSLLTEIKTRALRKQV